MASFPSPIIAAAPDRVLRNTHCLPYEERIVVQALPAPSSADSRSNDGHLSESQTSCVRRSNDAPRTTRVASSDAIRRPRGRPRKFSPSNVGQSSGKTTGGRPRGRPRKFGPSTTLDIDAVSPQGINVTKSSGHDYTHKIMMVPFADDVSDAHPITGLQLGGIGDCLGDVSINKRGRTTIYRAKKNVSSRGSAVAPPRSPLNQLEQIILKNVDMYILSRVRESVDVVAKAHIATKSGSMKAAILQLEEVASMNLNTLLPQLSETLDLNLPPVDV